MAEFLSSSFPAVEPVLFDHTALEKLKHEMGAEFVVEVVELFFKAAPEQVDRMRQALKKDQREELRRAAHSLKSNCASVGAMVFAADCQNLEAIAATVTVKEAEENLVRLEADFAQIKPLLETIRKAS